MSHPRGETGAEPPGAGKPETTASLLAQAKSGDEAARNRLMTRLLPGFRRWARGRVPARARSILDTDDLVQVSLLKALNHLSDFEPRSA